jgi:hypothetical protein
MRREARLLLRVVAVLFGAVVLAGGASAAFASTYTWSGGDSSSADWSVGDNWAGGSAPTVSDSGDSLVFPADLAGGDCASTQDDACYAAVDDLPGYAVDGLMIDDGAGYDVGGIDPLMLGSGGISATTSSSAFDPSEIDTPIVLSALQTWSVDGGSSGAGGLIVDGGTTGTSEALDVELSNEGLLDLGLGSDNEVGDVTIYGKDSDVSWQDAFRNGALELGDGSSLNASDGSTIALGNAAIVGDGTVGPINSSSGVIAPGDPLGSLTINGPLTMDYGSALQFAIADSGTTPGKDYSQLRTTGSIDFGGGDLDVTGSDANNDCPSLDLGSVYTLIRTTGPLSGTFVDADSGTVGDMDCNGPVVPELQFTFNTATEPNTVTATVEGPADASSNNIDMSPPFPPTAGQTVTLTSEVSTPGQTPSGTVAFANEGDPIPGCASQPVSLVTVQVLVLPSRTTEPRSLNEATCTTTAGAAGSPYAYQAFFNATDPKPGGQWPSSSNVDTGTVVASVVRPPATSVASVGRAHTNGTVADAPVNCIAGGAACAIRISLGVIETLRRGKVTAIAASATPKAKAIKRNVIVGTAMVTLDAGQSQTVAVPLNETGQRLLKKRHALAAALTGTNGDSRLSRQIVDFKAPTHKPASKD